MACPYMYDLALIVRMVVWSGMISNETNNAMHNFSSLYADWLLGFLLPAMLILKRHPVHPIPTVHTRLARDRGHASLPSLVAILYFARHHDIDFVATISTFALIFKILGFSALFSDI